MVRLLLRLAFLCGLSGFPGEAMAAQAGGGAEEGKLEQIIPGHYVYSSGARLSGIIATNEGAVVLDALSNEAMARHERALIAATIKQPVRYLISSTFHGNYALGNVAYPDSIKIGTENYRADLLDLMKKDNMPAATQTAMLPQVTFKDRMTLNLGGKEIQILYMGRAHTRGDAVVFVPQDRIVYLSEVFFDGRFPFMSDGYLDWIATIDSILKLDADIFVPGQGPSSIASDPRGSRASLLRAQKVLMDFRDAVRGEIGKGATEEQAVANVLLPQYRGMVGYDQQRAVLVRRMYQGLKGTLP